MTENPSTEDAGSPPGTPPIDPATLTIKWYPAPILRTKAEPVQIPPTDEVKAVARRMVHMMREAEGIGLAATQVGLPWRLFVADVAAPDPADLPPDVLDALRPADGSPGFSIATSGPVCYLNPVIEEHIGRPDPFEEGCLSLPDVRGKVVRPPRVRVSAFDLDGNKFEVRAAGLLGRCIQHEIDHLDGVMIFDKMTPISKRAAKSQLKKLEAGARPARR